MTIDQIKTAADTNIRAKTADNSVTRDEVADLFDNLADEQRDRGLYGVDTTAGLAAVSGANYRKVAVGDTGIFEWASTGTANGTTIFAASGGGVWILKMTVKNNQIVTFNQQVPFTKMYSYAASHSITANLTFTPLSAGAIPGAVTHFKVIADGTHTIAFTGIKQLINSSGYDNRYGIVNYLSFFYDGADYFVNIYQELNAQAIDMVAPSFVSAQTPNLSPNTIVITFNEALNNAIVPSNSDFTVSGGKTVTGVAVAGTLVTLTLNSSYSFGDTITASYVSGTNKLQDAAGNIVSNFSNQAVTNNIGGSAQIVQWENLVNATDSGGFINYSAPTAGGRGTIPINTANPFEVYAEFTSLSPATVLFLDKDSANAYSWGVTQEWEAGCYHVGGLANHAVSNAGYFTFDNAFTPPAWFKFRKSGNNIILSRSSSENGTYTDVHTFTNALVSISTLYIHVLFAANTVGDKIQVKFIN